MAYLGNRHIGARTMIENLTRLTGGMMSIASVRLGIAGHAGIGHAHCPGGLIQDDTAGFAVVGAIIRDILDADTSVESVDIDTGSNTIRVTTADGGTGESSPRRGITPAEARLMRAIVGGDALLCQTLAVEALGRMYGQGVLETPVALAAALANAAIDTFHRVAPAAFHVTTESLATNSGFIGALSTELKSVRTAVMATVNASALGIGPNEDLEGNVALGSKGALMRQLEILRSPTIVLEGKAYSPSLSDGLRETTLLVRCQRDVDNIVVAEALHQAAQELGYPVIFLDNVFPFNKGGLKRKTVETAERLAQAAERLKKAESGVEKVRLVAELATLVSEECGGVSFMTNGVHDVVRQVGMIPGTAAVLSMLVTRDYLAHWKIPILEPADIDMMKRTVYAAIPHFAARLDEANAVRDRLYVDIGGLESLLN